MKDRTKIWNDNHAKLAKVVLILTSMVTASTGAISAKTLEANIEHKEVLPSIPPNLRAGSTFDQDALSQETQSKWFQIPEWLAGDWQRTVVKKRLMGMVTASVADRRVRQFGQQLDNQGEIWHWVKIPRQIVSERAKTISYFLTRDEDISDIKEKSVKIRTIWTAWTVNKANRVILNVQQGDQIDLFQKKKKGNLKVDSYSQYYDQNGRRKGAQKAFWDERKIEDFRQLDSQNGISIRQLFEDYLRSIGKENLI